MPLLRWAESYVGDSKKCLHSHETNTNISFVCVLCSQTLCITAFYSNTQVMSMSEEQFNIIFTTKKKKTTHQAILLKRKACNFISFPDSWCLKWYIHTRIHSGSHEGVHEGKSTNRRITGIHFIYYFYASRLSCDEFPIPCNFLLYFFIFFLPSDRALESSLEARNRDQIIAYWRILPEEATVVVLTWKLRRAGLIYLLYPCFRGGMQVK